MVQNWVRPPLEALGLLLEDSRGAKCPPELLTGSARGANMSSTESKVSSKRLEDSTLAAL